MRFQEEIILFVLPATPHFMIFSPRTIFYKESAKKNHKVETLHFMIFLQRTIFYNEFAQKMS